MIGGAIRYFTIVFVAAFAFGTVRTLWIAPAIGATAAVTAEVPLILIVSLLACRRLFGGAPAMACATAIGTGVIAFALLMAAEVLLATTLFGMDLAAWQASLIRMPGPIGLAGQVMFALMPLIWRVLRGPRSSPPRPQ